MLLLNPSSDINTRLYVVKSSFIPALFLSPSLCLVHYFRCNLGGPRLFRQGVYVYTLLHPPLYPY